MKPQYRYTEHNPVAVDVRITGKRLPVHGCPKCQQPSETHATTVAERTGPVSVSLQLCRCGQRYEVWG